MAYSAKKWTTANNSPTTQKNQPIGFWERVATTAPTVEKPIASAVFSIQCSKPATPGSKVFRVRSRRARAVSTREKAHIDQEIKPTVRALILPILRPRS